MIISIWGFMGSGKSTLGKYIANNFNWQQVDTDAEIEKKAGKSITDLFTERGEEYFRDLETEYLHHLVSEKEKGQLTTNILLTTGGGMPLRDENRKLLQKLGPSFFLNVPFEEIARRLQQDQDRPLWDNTQLVLMEQKYKQRLPIYGEADVRINPEGKDVAIMAEEILHYVHKRELSRGK